MDKQIKPWIIFSTLAVIFFSYLLLGWLAGYATATAQMMKMKELKQLRS